MPNRHAFSGAVTATPVAVLLLAVCCAHASAGFAPVACEPGQESYSVYSPGGLWLLHGDAKDIVIETRNTSPDYNESDARAAAPGGWGGVHVAYSANDTESDDLSGLFPILRVAWPHDTTADYTANVTAVVPGWGGVCAVYALIDTTVIASNDTACNATAANATAANATAANETAANATAANTTTTAVCNTTTVYGNATTYVECMGPRVIERGPIPGTAAGGTFTAALDAFREDGTIDAASLRAGIYHACVLRSSGAIVCTGVAVAIAAIHNNTCHLGNATVDDSGLNCTFHNVSDGGGGYELVYGYYNASGALVPCNITDLDAAFVAVPDVCDYAVPGSFMDGLGSTQTFAGPYTALTNGATHSCAIDAAGGAWCWGANAYGQLGTGDTEPRSGPTPVAAPSGFHGAAAWVAISAGQSSTCGIVYDTGITRVDTVVCWGDFDGDVALETGTPPGAGPTDNGTVCVNVTSGPPICGAAATFVADTHTVCTLDATLTTLACCALRDNDTFAANATDSGNATACWTTVLAVAVADARVGFEFAGALTPLATVTSGSAAVLAANADSSFSGDTDMLCAVSSTGALWCSLATPRQTKAADTTELVVAQYTASHVTPQYFYTHVRVMDGMMCGVTRTGSVLASQATPLEAATSAIVIPHASPLTLKHAPCYAPLDPRTTDTACVTGTICSPVSCNIDLNACVAEPVLCDDDDVCSRDLCDPLTGECTFTDIVCTDYAHPCTIRTCSPDSGKCVSGATVSCTAPDPCTLASCIPGAGTCAYADRDCDDSNPCTTDYCNPAIGCVYDMRDCGGGNDECGYGYCNPLTGECVNGSRCDDAVAIATATSARVPCIDKVCHEGRCIVTHVPGFCDADEPGTYAICTVYEGTELCDVAPLTQDTDYVDYTAYQSAFTAPLFDGMAVSLGAAAVVVAVAASIWVCSHVVVSHAKID